MSYFTQNETKEILEGLFNNKYTYCDNPYNIKRVFSCIQFVSVLFTLIEKDIIQNKPFSKELYVMVLEYLFKEKVLSSKSWSRTGTEIKILIDTDIYFCFLLLSAKIINITEITDCYDDCAISYKIMSHINKIVVTNPMKIPSLHFIFDLMVIYSIPVNFKDMECCDISYVLSSYFADTKNITNFLLNVLQHDISADVFDDLVSSEIFGNFFNSQKFYEKFEFLPDKVISNFGKYIVKTNRFSLCNSYNKFVEKIQENCDYLSNNFISKFVVLLQVVQNKIVNQYDFNSIDYSLLLINTTKEDLEKLNFKTLLTLDLIKNNKYIPKIYDAFMIISSRDIVDVSLLRDKIESYEYNRDTNAVDHLHILIKMIIFDVKKDKISSDKIDLLFFALNKCKFNQEELNELTNIFTQYHDENYIATKLIGVEDNELKIATKIFPKTLQSVLRQHVKLFDDKIKKITEISEKDGDIEQQIELLSSLKKINDSESRECKICTIKEINSYYRTCGHTICSDCAERTNGKCPNCNTYSTVNRLFFN